MKINIFARHWKGLLQVLLIGAGSRILQILLSVLIARSLGPQDFGQYVYIISLSVLFSFVSTLGFPHLMVKFIPAYITKNDHPSALALVATSIVATFLGSVLCYVCAFLLSTGGQRSVDDAFSPEIIASIIALPLGLKLLLRNILVAYDKGRLASALDEGYLSLILLIAVVAMKLDDLAVLLTAYFIACTFVVMSIAIFLFISEFRHQRFICAFPLEIKHWLRVGVPLMAAILFKTALSKIDVLMLAPLSDFDQVGLYGAAFKLTFIVTFPAVVLGFNMLPKLSYSYSEKQYEDFKALAVLYLSLILCFAVVSSCTLIFMSDLILDLVYGPKFIVAATCLTILAIAQIFGSLLVFTLSVVTILNGHRFLMISNLVALIGCIFLNSIFIPDHGAEGAATVTLLTLLGLCVSHLKYIAKKYVELV